MNLRVWRRTKKLKTSDISAPANFKHLIHAYIDARSGRMVGLPKQWSSIVEVETVNRRVPLISTEQTTSAYPGRVIVGASSPSTSATSSTPASSPFTANNDPPIISVLPTSRSANFANGTTRGSIDDVRNALKGIVEPLDPRNGLHSVCVLGNGSSGSVVNVYNVDLRRNLALKRMIVAKQQRPEMLISELQIMKKSSHPNIIEYFSSHYIEDTDELWILMELASNGPLTDYILRKRLNEEQIATISEQTLNGLAFLHSMKIVHRDLKSDSILFASNMCVKISDFGFAVTLTAQYPKRRSLLGSTYWLPPELSLFLIVNREFHWESADIWSFGITVIEMITGEPPHYNCLPSIAIDLIKKEDPVIPEEYQISAELQQFLDAMLRRDPTQRKSAAVLQRHKFLRIALKDPTQLQLL